MNQLSKTINIKVLFVLIPGIYLFLIDKIFINFINLNNYKTILTIQSSIYAIFIILILGFLYFEVYRNRKNYIGEEVLYLFIFIFFSFGLLVGLVNFSIQDIGDIQSGVQYYDGKCNITYFKRSLGRKTIEEETRITLFPNPISVSVNKGIPDRTEKEIPSILPYYEEVERNYECKNNISLYYLKNNLITLDLN